MTPKTVADSFVVSSGPHGFAVAVQQCDVNSTPSPESFVPLSIVAEIRCSPIVAKQLLHAMMQQLQRYEEIFGEIRVHDSRQFATKPN